MTNTIPTTTTFNQNAGQMITRAYRMLNVVSEAGTPNADQMNQAIFVLNAMLKGWQADGTNLWRREQITIPVLASQGSPSTPIIPTTVFLDLLEARWVVQGGSGPDQSERPMGIFTYLDYMTLPNKNQQSDSGPSVICFDKQTSASQFYVWPLPTYGGQLKVTVARPVYDVTKPSDIVDAPIEWTEAIVYNLADRLLADSAQPMIDPQGADYITQRAVALYSKLLNFDRPPSVFIRPWGKKGSGPFWR